MIFKSKSGCLMMTSPAYSLLQDQRRPPTLNVLYRALAMTQLSELRRQLSYSTLCCTVVHCTVLPCTALHGTALHCTALHCTALHCTALHFTCLHWTATSHTESYFLGMRQTECSPSLHSLSGQDMEETWTSQPLCRGLKAK